MREAINDRSIRDALYNLTHNSGASQDYCRGLVLGMWCIFVSFGWKYDEILGVIRHCLPDQYRLDCLPDTLREDILNGTELP